MSASATAQNRGKFLERFIITPPDETDLVGLLYKSPYRTGGRRIVVESQAGEVLLDTDFCFDHANAVNRLDLWLMERYPSLCPRQKAGC